MRLYNSLTRQVEEIQPLEEGHVTMYSCGPTVYRYAHLGNLRTFMLADLIRRALMFEGLRVTQIMNITDVGHMTDESSTDAVDKMLLAVEDEGLQPLEIAEKYSSAVFEEAAAVGIRPADRYPKATEHIPEMLELTRTLVDQATRTSPKGAASTTTSRPSRTTASSAGTHSTTCVRATETSRPIRTSATPPTSPSGRLRGRVGS